MWITGAECSEQHPAQKIGEGYELDAKLWAGLWMIDHNLDGTPRA